LDRLRALHARRHHELAAGRKALEQVVQQHEIIGRAQVPPFYRCEVHPLTERPVVESQVCRALLIDHIGNLRHGRTIEVHQVTGGSAQPLDFRAKPFAGVPVPGPEFGYPLMLAPHNALGKGQVQKADAVVFGVCLAEGHLAALRCVHRQVVPAPDVVLVEERLAVPVYTRQRGVFLQVARTELAVGVAEGGGQEVNVRRSEHPPKRVVAALQPA